MSDCDHGAWQRLSPTKTASLGEIYALESAWRCECGVQRTLRAWMTPTRTTPDLPRAEGGNDQ